MTKTPTDIDDDQQRIVELLHSFDDALAPQSVHLRIDALLAHQQERRFPRPRFGLRFSLPVVAGAVVAVAAVALAIAVGLGDGGGNTPTLSPGQAAAPTLQAATLPPPAESSTHHAQLLAAVDGVPFPYWSERFGWRSSGARADRIDGRTVTTVFYANSRGQRVGYAIFAGSPAPKTGGAVTWRGGVAYRLLKENGAAVVTWLRDGRLCVVSGRGVSSATLLKLASWSDRRATVS